MFAGFSQAGRVYFGRSYNQYSVDKSITLTSLRPPSPFFLSFLLSLFFLTYFWPSHHITPTGDVPWRIGHIQSKNKKRYVILILSIFEVGKNGYKTYNASKFFGCFYLYENIFIIMFFLCGLVVEMSMTFIYFYEKESR